ncbi:hypothetical protein [Novosphingobium sp. Chol11]|uniref:hypothetical protein n=1 Tax=Novosphingobium sp. Chol11 TaxID=1385763 RepID=UPI000BE3C8C6|nr:hypothetical protein [Novosphingobium sp. Chol11]
MTAGFDLILIGQALAALLFLGASWPSAIMSGQTRRHAALVGTMILSAVAVYDMDVINGPDIIGALIVGGGFGLLLGREWPRGRWMPLLTIFTGFSAAAMLCAAAAAWLNPYAFGLVDEGSIGIAARHMLALAVVTMGGIGASTCALGALLGGERSAVLLLVLAIAMAGWSAAALALLLENVGLLAAGGLSAAAGTGVALRICGGARGKGLADAGSHP